jgi:4-alpha-glucanotransferase
MSKNGDLAAQFGIQRDYLDNAGQPAQLDDATVQALRDAIGREPSDLGLRGPLVVRSGQHADAALAAQLAAEPCRVTLESGEQQGLLPDGLPGLPLGYHWLETASGRRRLIVCPEACVPPPQRMWGWTAQLYATRSRDSWGIGDLGDLATLTRLARSQGAGFVLVNPLHAAGSPLARGHQQPSPYFPASRRFLNPIYLAVAEVAGAAEVLGSRLAAHGRTARGGGASAAIDRDATWSLKRNALREVFERTDAAASPAFKRWRADAGAAMQQFAAWCVLSERHNGDWRSWPAAARHPDGEEARQVLAQEPGDVAFVCWLQWQSERQLQAAGEPVRVLQDLPIGVDPAGADAWAYQDLLAAGMTIGSPPDPFNRAGQNWGLPPVVPWRLRQANYEPFIQAIRATMALAGGLRIDHVMGLFRLWWVPAGESADRGGYVRYPAADLLDIVALESHRAQAPVVGEDLGTVEPGVREVLAARNVLSYRLLWFESDPPPSWPSRSLAAIGTHDLPTVAGLWDGSDLAEQQEFGLDADAEATSRLRTWLVEAAGLAPDAPPEAAVSGAHRLLAEAPSVLLAASLDDALAETVRPNIPGTADRPNWSHPLAVPLEDFATHPGVTALAAILQNAVDGDGDGDEVVGTD